jgi:O-acetyl-ADP-ribose deacetylase (regulator of RNase III)
MDIEYVRGDLLAAGETVIAHGCNAQGKFGRGVALAIKERFPAAHAAYDREFQKGELKLGTVIWAKHEAGYVANCVVQPTYGYRGTGVHIDYAAFRSCMRAINDVAKKAVQTKIDRIAMPLIGADRGGGDWNLIAEIIEQELTDVQPVVYVLPGVRFEPPSRQKPLL